MHGQRNEFEIDIDFPENYSIAERSAYIKQVEEYVEQRKVELGIKSYETHFSPWYAEFEGHFSDDRVSKFSTEEVAEEGELSIEERQRLEMQESLTGLVREKPENVAQLIRMWLVEE